MFMELFRGIFLICSYRGHSFITSKKNKKEEGAAGPKFWSLVHDFWRRDFFLLSWTFTSMISNLFWHTGKAGPMILTEPKTQDPMMTQDSRRTQDSWRTRTLGRPKTLGRAKNLGEPRTLGGLKILGGHRTLWGPRTLRGPMTRIIPPIKYSVWLNYFKILYFI